MAGSGIFSTFGYAPEAAWSTFVAPNHFVTMQSEGFAFKKGTVTEKTLHGGLYDLSSRRAYVKKGAAGTLTCAPYSRGLGLMFYNMLGASVTTSGGFVLYPGDTTGKSMSVQVGRPMTSNASVQAFSYEGTKVTDWEIGIKAGEFGTFVVNFDAEQEDTTQAYTAPSYAASTNIFSSVLSTLILGGTPSTSGSITTISGAPRCSWPSPYRSSPPTRWTPTATSWVRITSSSSSSTTPGRSQAATTIQFQDLTTVYNAFASDTPVALQLYFQGAGSTALNVLIPQIYWDEDNLPVSGPQLIDQNVTFTGYDDGVNNQVQFTYITPDSNL